MFKNKEQILVVPVNYVFSIDNGFIGTTLLTKQSYTLYDSVGKYKPIYEVENNICLIRISVMLLVENERHEFLVKELYDKQKKPYLEMGMNSYVKSTSGNYQALYNQLNTLTYYNFKDDLDFNYLGTICDLSNDSVKSILGSVYYTKTDKDNFVIKTKHDLYEYKWYNKQELIDKYNKATSWSRMVIDRIVDGSINDFIGRS